MKKPIFDRKGCIGASVTGETTCTCFRYKVSLLSVVEVQKEEKNSYLEVESNDIYDFRVFVHPGTIVLLNRLAPPGEKDVLVDQKAT